MKPVKLIIKTKSNSYPIFIGSNLIINLKKIFKENLITYNKCLLVIDKNVPKKMISKISKTIKDKIVYKYSFIASEKNKNQKNVDKILDILLLKNFSRQDCLIAVGGGITGDVSGYAASIYKRGLQFVNIPTTLLSQVDSSVGGKTGINTKHGKNLIGSFFQPKIVISDSSFLKTLPDREIICGYGEILKHSLIMNKKFFNYLNHNATNILKLKTPFVEKAIFESCKIKKTVVEKDEDEKNLRKMLNFGHTFAHAYEATLNFSRRLNHGEAVILGIVTALKFSLNNKYIKEKEFISIIGHIKKFKMPSEVQYYFSNKHLNKILSFMVKDKKNNSNKINLILLKKIGSALINNQFSIQKIKVFLKQELRN
jgi:3-dehydroquinate synthase